MKVLVLGAGGREHALVWGLTRSASVSEVIVAPGNPGTETIAQNIVINPSDPAAVVELANQLNVDLVVVGPEDPLVAGVVDAVQASGRHAFGPNAAGAQLEGSKAWMKEVLAGAGVPTAAHGSFTDADTAIAFLNTLDGLFVVKTDGLAAGKGVVVTKSYAEAEAAVYSYLSGEAFGPAGHTVVIEEGLRGPELSLLVICNGDPDGAVPLAPAQDFKRIHDDDLGPNTGGMGAYSPVPAAGPELIAQVMATAVTPTLHSLAATGIEYRGVLYAGIMLTADGPKVLEYNVRFGDPECQVIIPRLATDLGELCWASATGEPLPEIKFRDEACVTVVLASENYPASPRTGDVIDGLAPAEKISNTAIFHAGTARRATDGKLITAGGRVLAVSAWSDNIVDARARAYECAQLISWPGQQYRTDIARSVGKI